MLARMERLFTRKQVAAEISDRLKTHTERLRKMKAQDLPDPARAAQELGDDLLGAAPTLQRDGAQFVIFDPSKGGVGVRLLIPFTGEGSFFYPASSGGPPERLGPAGRRRRPGFRDRMP
jgi:hypothetical protein